MEDITLALITLTSFVLLFVVAIFADRAGMQADDAASAEAVLVPLDDSAVVASPLPSASVPRAVDVDVA